MKCRLIEVNQRQHRKDPSTHFSLALPKVEPERHFFLCWTKKLEISTNELTILHLLTWVWSLVRGRMILLRYEELTILQLPTLMLCVGGERWSWLDTKESVMFALKAMEEANLKTHMWRGEWKPEFDRRRKFRVTELARWLKIETFTLRICGGWFGRL